MPILQPKILLTIAGLVCVIASLAVGFLLPFGIWHWVLLALAGGLLVIRQRM